MSESPTNEGFKINSADIIRSRYSVTLHDQEFLAVRSDDRLDIYRQGVETPVGHITFGSLRSGAIWKGSECVGEYFADADGEYAIIPINENRKATRIIRGIDPILYLLELLT